MQGCLRLIFCFGHVPSIDHYRLWLILKTAPPLSGHTA